MAGASTGKMAYDISKGFPSSYNTNASMDITVKADNINVTGKMQMGGTMNFTITNK